MRGSDLDVHLMGGPRTIRALAGISALDQLELLILPLLLGDGSRSPSGGPAAAAAAAQGELPVPDGTAELVYAVD